MFTFFNLYMSLYLISYISLFYTLILVFNNKFSVNMPLNYLTNLSLKYTKLSKFLLFLLLSLSGLPPFSFLVKFNFLQEVYVFSTHLLQISAFSNFSISTFFYLQFYNAINIKNKNINSPDLKHYRVSMIKSTSREFNKVKYRITFCLSVSFFILFFTLFMYIDLFIIFHVNGI